MNNNLKINIFFDFKDGIWGGCNQFFKILKKEFIKLGVYEEDPIKADVILFYGYHKLREVIDLKKKYPSKFFIYRLGAVFHYHRGANWKIIDRLLIQFAKKLADMTIFISNWLYNEYKQLGFNDKKYNIITNAVDSKIFNCANLKPRQDNKIRLVAASWSTNNNKGFGIYKYLDEHLDFSKYSFVFVGNSPIKFKNIKTTGPLVSEDLSEQFKNSDIYITATEEDAYSNTIVEALATGLPVVAIKSGGNPEVLSSGGGILFEGQQDVVAKIVDVSDNYEHYKAKIKHKNSEQIAQEYMGVIRSFVNEKPRKRSIALELEYNLMFFLFKLKQKINYSLEKMMGTKRAAYRYYKWTWHRNILNGLIFNESKKIKGEILDVGSRSRRYDQSFNGVVTAIDIEPNYEKKVVYGDIQNLQYTDEQFDSIICIEVLCFVPNLKKAISEIYRVLKPDGYALISNPFMQHDHDDRHRMTKFYAEELFREAGFTQVGVEAYGNGHIAVWDIARKKMLMDKPYLQRKVAYYLILLPWLSILKTFKLDKVKDKYYTGLFITLKK